MSIYKTAYDTTACRGFVTSKITEGLYRASIQGFLSYNKVANVNEVQGGHLVDELVPSFYHPIIYIDEDGAEQLAIDMRGLGKYDHAQGQFIIRDSASYDGLMTRAVLNKVWLQEIGQDKIRNLSTFPLSVYSNWIGEAVSKRLALDPQDQFTVSVLAAILYLNLFWDKEKSANPNKIDKTFLVSSITRGLNYKADTVYDIVEQWAGLSSVEEFCTACKEQSQSTRMRDLNAATLFAMVGGYWYGVNGRELIAVALEHPPTWLSLLWQALYHRGYQNAGLTKILERSTYKRQSGQFGLSLSGLVRDV